MVAKNIPPPQGGMVGTPHYEGSSSNDSLFMCDHTIDLKIESKNYDTFDHIATSHEATSSSHLGGPLQIKNPCFDAPLHSSKGVL
jgi:hypothetical protein